MVPAALSLDQAIRALFRRLLGHENHDLILSEVRQATSELRSTALVLRERLEPYENARDPFVAMIADIYERQQEANVWRGPP